MSTVRRFRNSQLALRRECPWAYARTYLDGDEGVPSEPLRRGQDFHKAVCEAIRQLMRDGMVNIHQVAYRYVRGGDAEYAEVLILLQRFQEALGTEFDVDPAHILYLESPLEMDIELSDGRRVVFWGTPDLAERVKRGLIRIRDWKTQWRPETEHEFRAGQQLKRYALLAWSDLGGGQLSFILEKRFIRYEDAHFAERITVDDLHQVRMQLVAEIEEVIRFEEAGDFRPTPGSWCSLCSHHATCPVMLRARRLQVDLDLSIGSDDRARELAEEVVAWEAGAEERKGRLKRYLGSDHATGYVDVAGGTFGFGPVNQREVPVGALRDAFEENGFEATDELFKVDLGALDRFLRRAPEDLRNAVERVTIRSQTSQCRFRRTALPNQQLATTPASADDPEDLFS